jgi:hypothetical protein
MTIYSTGTTSQDTSRRMRALGRKKTFCTSCIHFLEAADRRLLAAGLPDILTSKDSRDLTTFIQTMARQQAGNLNLSIMTI